MANFMTFEDFINKYEGTYVEWDENSSKNQCVDFVKAYIQLCCPDEDGNPILTGKGKAAWGNAKDYYLDYTSNPKLKANFTRHKNTAKFIPQQGDIGVFGATNTNEYGHIVVCDKGCTLKTLYSYDQNYGSNKKVRRVKHNYDNFLGVLRPKFKPTTTTPVAPPPAPAPVTKSYKVNTNALNVRKGAGTTYGIAKVIYRNETVKVIEINNGWAKLGDNLYCMASYLKEV